MSIQTYLCGENSKAWSPLLGILVTAFWEPSPSLPEGSHSSQTSWPNSWERLKLNQFLKKNVQSLLVPLLPQKRKKSYWGKQFSNISVLFERCRHGVRHHKILQCKALLWTAHELAWCWCKTAISHIFNTAVLLMAKANPLQINKSRRYLRQSKVVTSQCSCLGILMLESVFYKSKEKIKIYFTNKWLIPCGVKISQEHEEKFVMFYFSWKSV